MFISIICQINNVKKLEIKIVKKRNIETYKIKNLSYKIFPKKQSELI